MIMMSRPFPARSSINSQIVWKIKMNIRVTNELEKLNRNLLKIYWSKIRNGLVSYDVVAEVLIPGFIKSK